MDKHVRRIKAATANYPRFPDGRIDYTNEKVCFVLNCVVMFKNEILLTLRGENVIVYRNTFSGVSGFIDAMNLSIREQAILELQEEVSMPSVLIRSLQISEPFVQYDKEIGREWHVLAVLVESSKKFSPVTNWENKSVEWHQLSEIDHLDLSPGFPETLQIALRLRSSANN